MNGFFKKISLVLLLVIGVFTLGVSQSQSELEKKRSQKDKEIQELDKLLKETRLNKQKNELQLVLIDKKITAREAIINIYSQEVSIIDGEIENQKNEIEEMQANLRLLKEEYALMLYYAYKNNNSFDLLAFVFSADDFSAAYRRLKYIQDYTAFRQEQAKLIIQTQLDLENKIVDLEKKRNQKQLLIVDKQTEKESLKEEKGNKEIVYKDLKSNEKKLREDLKRKKREREQLNKALNDLIAAELARLKREANKGKTTTGVPLKLTPEAQQLANSFASNKGKLPWPVKKATISKNYGNQANKVFTNIIEINNGVDILTEKGAEAEAVFKGKVSGVIILPDGKFAVLIAHGDYFTLYGNLSKVYVKKGDEVDTKEPLGTIRLDPKSGLTELHFEVWQVDQHQNPLYWLLK